MRRRHLRTSALSTCLNRCQLLWEGAAHVTGFCDLLRQQLRRSTFPLRWREVRPAADIADAIARGCLIHAELERGERGLRKAG